MADNSTRRDMLLAGAASAVAGVPPGVAATPANIQLAQAAQQVQAQAAAEGRRPNILVIWGDDIGWQNVSAYGLGTMGYRTPNIDRIANEGIKFVDHYAQPSCTAGRAAFVTGQYPIRSGMTTVGQPGDELGLKVESPSIAEVMRAQGYRCGHFGKSHLGDRNEHLPTNHGFHEFYGNLYHLNVSEQYQQRDYQNWARRDPNWESKFSIRGVIHSIATDVDDATVDPRFGRVGRQRITDTGPLPIDRMRNFDGAEVIPRALTFMRDAVQAGQNFFVWLNSSRMHLYTHLPDQWRYAVENITSEADLHGSGMMQHDHDIGTVLQALEEMGVARDTIVLYSTDNGPEHSSWPYGATTPFRGEKMTTWEGGVRVICMVRWPARIRAGQVMNGIQAHQDLFTTLAAAAGEPDAAGKMMREKRQYIDGVNNLPYWLGQNQDSARDHIFHYYESTLMALRMGPWKWHYSTKDDYYADVIPRTVPILVNVRMDPMESYISKDSYGHLLQKMSWLMAPMGELVANHIKSLQDYPPVQGGKTFDMSDVINQTLRTRQ